MPKTAISLTLDGTNLLWLKGRARVLAGGSLSAAVDQLIDEARAGRLGAAEPPRSVVGTIDLPNERALESGAAELRARFTGSLDRAILLHEDPPAARKKSPKKK